MTLMPMSSTQLYCGDAAALLRDVPDASIDAIVTDPPYGLSDMSPAAVRDVIAAWACGQTTTVTARGFMGKDWDSFVPGPELWRECYRVLKPGGHALVFAGSRTVDLMGIALRLAGFEMRDTLAWVYGSGFPKSLNVAKAIERLEISAIERKFCQWIRDESGLTSDDIGTDRFHAIRVEIVNTATADAPRWGRRALIPTAAAWSKIRAMVKADVPDWVDACVKDPPKPPITHPGQWRGGAGEGVTGDGPWAGWGTALKPAREPILLVRKPLDGTVAQNVLAHGVGGLNIDGCRVPTNENLNGGAYSGERREKTGAWQSSDRVDGKGSGFRPGAGEFTPPAGRWPPNLLLTHLPECRAVGTREGKVDGIEAVSAWACALGCPVAALNAKSGQLTRGSGDEQARLGDAGGASRFFPTFDWALELEETDVGLGLLYCAKAGRGERNAGVPAGNIHPTVKPIKLMQWLVRLITPPGGQVLDPFMGSGTTGVACVLEGFDFTGMEKDPTYLRIAEARIQHRGNVDAG